MYLLRKNIIIKPYICIVRNKPLVICRYLTNNTILNTINTLPTIYSNIYSNIYNNGKIKQIRFYTEYKNCMYKSYHINGELKTICNY